MEKFNKIVKSFTKVIKQLDGLADDMQQLQEYKTLKIRSLKEQCNNHEVEMNAAIKVADKLRGILDYPDLLSESK